MNDTYRGIRIFEGNSTTFSQTAQLYVKGHVYFPSKGTKSNQYPPVVDGAFPKKECDPPELRKRTKKVGTNAAT
ncbi:hypothetical protein M514_04130 [Trichuris suis]|uniref:Uncharacterized protein n=1 Tax=Trichuris suis TaxID=68888 RepID=A0A085MCK2_9BILA|nr:hypothetical protein M513_04130 [Trichuris suis]KFD68425.1 hypothetical protein M514_04130 [Trichuris suis]